MSRLRAAELRRRLWKELGLRGRSLRALVREADQLGVRVFLVGGPVRDLLLNLPVIDLDVLLSDGLDQVAACAEQLGGRAVVRPRFLTATIEWDEVRIDLSRARRERYARPGALPDVAPTSIEEDLLRRDFSVNALALPLARAAGDRLVDPVGGLEDLRKRRIRTLHKASFLDDPTRMFRGARYAARLRGRFTRATRRELAAALAADALRPVSGARILHEIERLLQEVDLSRAAALSASLGLFDALVPGWRLDRTLSRALRRLAAIEGRLPWPEAASGRVRLDCGLRLLLCGVPPRKRVVALRRLGLHGRPAQLLRDELATATRLARRLQKPISGGKLDILLGELSEPALLMLYCFGTSRAAAHVALFASQIRHRPSPIDGHAARALGARGPEIGALLHAARERDLDGRLVDRTWLRRWMARRRRMG